MLQDGWPSVLASASEIYAQLVIGFAFKEYWTALTVS